MQPPPSAIVLDGNQRAALAAVRSLGRRGVTVVAAESSHGSLASASRYCKGTMVYPDPAKSPDAFMDWLADTGRRHPQTVLMPMTDLTVPLVLQLESDAPAPWRTALPSLEAYQTVSDKYRLFELARREGIQVPQTMVLTRANVGRLDTQGLRYPVVVKPRLSSMRLASGIVKRAVQYASDAAHLSQLVATSLTDDDDELLLQEYIEGHGAGVFVIYQHGTPLLFFAHRRVREKPPSGGISVVCESVPLPQEGVETVKRLLDPLQWHGVAMVEFKVDAAGQLWLVEINARFWGSLQLAVDCGADFPWLLYQLAAGAQPTPTQSYAVGRRLRFGLGDLDNLYSRLRSAHWTPTVRSKLSAIADFLVPWQPGLRYELLRASDPAPAFRALGQYLHALKG